jgi:hypothetical protein
MTVDIGEPRPTNDGLLYPVTYDGHHLSVLTRLSQDGRLWYVQIKSNFGEAAGNAADPQQAFRPRQVNLWACSGSGRRPRA